MRARALTAAVLALAVAATAAAKDPVLGVSSGPQGVRAPHGGVKYVAMGARGGKTIVRAIRLGDRTVVRSRVVPGRYGIAVVASDGATGGVSADGATLVLPSLVRRPTTRFAVVDAATLAVRKVIELRGLFAYDALSPDGAILYAIEYLSADDYRIRAVNVATGGLYAAVVVDKREAGEPMTGYPATRATSRDGRWVYTLYGRGEQPPFVHALATTSRTAICIDLPWVVPRTTLAHVRMTVSRDGSRLVLRDRAGRVAIIRTANHGLEPIRPPR